MCVCVCVEMPCVVCQVCARLRPEAERRLRVSVSISAQSALANAARIVLLIA